MTLAEQIAEKLVGADRSPIQVHLRKFCAEAIREFSRAVAEKIRAEKPDWYDAARILEQESGERNNG